MATVNTSDVNKDLSAKDQDGSGAVLTAL